MLKILKKLVSITLAIVLGITLLPQVSVKAANVDDPTKEFSVQNPDGEYLYRLEISEDMLTYQLEMKNTNTNETTIVKYENGIATTLKDGEVVNVVDYNNSIKVAREYRNSSRAYRAKTVCIIPTLGGNNLWYQMGTTGADVGYMLMGCDWTYRVKADACSDCSTFRNKIIESNNLFAAAGLSDSAGIAVSALILAAGPTGGLSVALAAGLVGTAATSLVAACFAEQAAHDSYDIAKAYGTRQ